MLGYLGNERSKAMPNVHEWPQGAMTIVVIIKSDSAIFPLPLVSVEIRGPNEMWPDDGGQDESIGRFSEAASLG